MRLRTGCACVMIRAMRRLVAVLAMACGLCDVGELALQAQSGDVAASVLDGVFTADQASRGARTFERVCKECHDTSEFSGRRFRLSWVGRTTGDLFDTIATLMPEGDPGSLSPHEYVSVVAYLLELNGYPAGESALPPDLGVLRQMAIVEASQ